MDQVKTPEVPEVEEIDEIQIADAIALFNEALEKSDDDWDAAEELFSQSFDGMVELAREGDTDAQHNVALMYGYGINEPYDEDIDLLEKWVLDAEEDFVEYLRDLEDKIEDLEREQQDAAPEEVHIEASHEGGRDHSATVDHDKESRKLRRLYMMKARLERMGISTGANRDEYHDHDHD